MEDQNHLVDPITVDAQIQAKSGEVTDKALAVIRQVENPKLDCAHVDPETGERCGLEATQGTRSCGHHMRKGAIERPRTNMYSSFLKKAPQYAELVRAIENDPDAKRMEADIVQMRALAIRFMETNAKQIEDGNVLVIEQATIMLERLTKAIERSDSRKYVLSMTGISTVLGQVIAVIKEHLGDDPDRVRAIASDLAKIKLPPGSLSK